VRVFVALALVALLCAAALGSVAEAQQLQLAQRELDLARSGALYVVVSPDPADPPAGFLDVRARGATLARHRLESVGLLRYQGFYGDRCSADAARVDAVRAWAFTIVA
jgi:ABC-type amino acid transport substrate-binding protein